MLYGPGAWRRWRLIPPRARSHSNNFPHLTLCRKEELYCACTQSMAQNRTHPTVVVIIEMKLCSNLWGILALRKLSWALISYCPDFMLLTMRTIILLLSRIKLQYVKISKNNTSASRNFLNVPCSFKLIQMDF